MKKLALTLCLSALVTGAYAQGLINFGNNSTTLVSSGSPGVALPSGAAGTYFLGLFVAPSGSSSADQFTFSGSYATNTAAAGRFSGGTAASVTGVQPGNTRAIMVAAWSATLGHDWNPVWLTGGAAAGTTGWFGMSPIAPNFVFGGFDGTGTIPTSVAFGGSVGIQAGFNAGTLLPVPEPTSMALAGLGAAAMLIFRRRN